MENIHVKLSEELEQLDDWGLARLAGAGDDRAFELLMGRYKHPVLNFIYRMIGDARGAEDLAQDVFVRTYRAIAQGKVSERGKFSTWLFQIARNCTLDELRRRKRHPSESIHALDEKGDSIASAGRTADEELVLSEVGEQIAAAVALLAQEQREVLVLSEYHDLSYCEIAAILNCSVKSVESRLYRARQFLRSKLGHLMHP